MEASRPVNHQTFEVRYEYLYGRQFNARLKEMPVGYLPIGTLERHGDHLPMGLDTLKAHAVCVHLARRIGGIVWPAHHYLGIHKKGAEPASFYAHWGNVYISETLARETLRQILRRAEQIGFKVIVLYTGHYPCEQIDLVRWASRQEDLDMRILGCCERTILGDGDHAGIWETSIFAALCPDLVRMDRIHALNRKQHGWDAAHDPTNADPRLGLDALAKITRRVRADVQRALKQVHRIR